jgi:hypothetical protein
MPVDSSPHRGIDSTSDSRGQRSEHGRGSTVSGTLFFLGSGAPAPMRTGSLPSMLHELSTRFEAFGATAPNRRNHAVAAYLRRYTDVLAQWRVAPDPLRTMPHWIAIPSLYAESALSARAKDSSDLPALLWAQFCAFLAVRLLDDLADRQAADPALPVLAHDVMTEARRALATGATKDERRRAGVLFRRSMHAIPRIAALQAEAAPSATALFQSYRQVNALFKALPLLLAQRAGNPAHPAALRRCYDELAMGMQILDDIEDFRSDFRAGRRTVVFALAHETYSEIRIHDSDTREPRFPAAAAVRIMAHARGCFTRAALATTTLGIPALTLLVHGYAASLDEEERLAKRRLR